MDVVLLIGRILFVMLFLSSAMGHLVNREAMAGYATQMGLPAAGMLVPLTGLQLLAGSVLVLLGIWADLGALLLALFLIPTALIMHAFWKVDDAQMRQNEMLHFMKDISLAGAALVMFAVFQQYGDSIDLMITGPLF